jgi:hypothetical protein
MIPVSRSLRTLIETYGELLIAHCSTRCPATALRPDHSTATINPSGVAAGGRLGALPRLRWSALERLPLMVMSFTEPSGPLTIAEVAASSGLSAHRDLAAVTDKITH